MPAVGLPTGRDALRSPGRDEMTARTVRGPP